MNRQTIMRTVIGCVLLLFAFGWLFFALNCHRVKDTQLIADPAITVVLPDPPAPIVTPVTPVSIDITAAPEQPAEVEPSAQADDTATPADESPACSGGCCNGHCHRGIFSRMLGR
jgi:hypothetical protein